jgi:hypothetical protein
MGELEACTRLTTVRRLCGHDGLGPRSVRDQSIFLINLAISPPPISQWPPDSAGTDLSSSPLTSTG